MKQYDTALMFLLSCLTFSGGCVSPQTDLETSGHVTLEHHNPGRVN
jgi:hypothetical protein